jgi:hypothetical protein
MAQAVTYAELLRRAKSAADMVYSNFLEAQDWLDLINASTRALYNKLTEADQDFYTTSTTLTTNGRDKTYRLPDDFYKLRGVDYVSYGQQRSMKKFSFRDRNRYQDAQEIIRYRLQGSNIAFEPVPSAQTITIWYVPVFEGFAEDDDEFDGVNGWEEWIVLDAAIKALISEESDPSALLIVLKGLDDKIESMKADRDIGEPERVGDVTSEDPFIRFPEGGVY